MLGFLPQPGEGELLYSVIARYGAMVGRSEGRALMREFFGSSANVVAMDLPAGLNRLVARIAEGVDPMVLIQDHTLFPYLFRFAPPVQADRAREWLLDGEGRRPPRIGVTAAAFARPDHLMLCPACVRADGGSGLSAWRREHQLPGVLVCPRHDVALLASRVTRANRRGAAAFVALTPEIARDAVPGIISRSGRSDLLGFAQDSAGLLELPAAACDLPGIQHRLRDLLRDFRWSRAPSLIASAELAAAFTQNAAVRALMSAMEVRWTSGQIATALNRLLYRGQVAKHPLLVLIVLRIAGATIEDLLAPTSSTSNLIRRVAEVRTKPAPRADLPCGNPACARHLEPVGPKLEAAGLLERVRGRCAVCGFTYQWDPRRPRETVVIETSTSWDLLLAQTLSDPRISLRAAARGALRSRLQP